MDDLSKTVAASSAAHTKKSVAGRWKPALLTASVPLGLAAVLWFVFREQLVRAVPVETGRVILMEQEGSGSSGSASNQAEMLFQASGWVEPAPWHVNLAAKIDGFVEDVYVKEGETVTNGQIVAALDATDARLALAIAEANVRKHSAALTVQQSAAIAAQEKAEAARFRVETVAARLSGERDTWERYSKTSPNVISLTERVQVKQSVLEHEASEKAARAELKALEAAAGQADSEVRVAAAAREEAVKDREEAQLALDRTVIRSDMDGIVLRRYVKPGDKRTLQADDPHSAVIASLYDPDQLQVRVDVPLAEAGKITVGQPARVFTAMLTGQTFSGRVTRIIGQADLQRNTLQAKVALDAPDERLRPDVLCRVEFWSAATSPTAGTTAADSHALWVPDRALLSGELEQEIWVVDPLTQTVHTRKIILTTAARGDLRQVVAGLRANEVVVLNPVAGLSEGARVKEVGE